jgi:hypothetical protein
MFCPTIRTKEYWQGVLYQACKTLGLKDPDTKDLVKAMKMFPAEALAAAQAMYALGEVDVIEDEYRFDNIDFVKINTNWQNYAEALKTGLVNA